MRHRLRRLNSYDFYNFKGFITRPTLMIYKLLNLRLLVAFLVLFISISTQAQPTAASGKTIFVNNCAQCHAKNMKTDATGPALKDFEERWADYDRQDLYDWIRNSQASIAAGHPRAVELWNQWKPTVMTAFPNLTDDDIESIVLYINEAANPPDFDLGPKGPNGQEESKNSWMYWILLGVLGILAVFLARIISNLNVLASKKANPDAVISQKSLSQTLTSKGVVGFLIFALVILGGYLTVNNAVNLGRQQGYAPEQPIKFSHETHAGVNGIDCQYCHDGARRSKHAVIPATNTCMNCHKAITTGSEYGTGEITKIYASIGYNPVTSKYIENYGELSNDEILAVYSEWIEKTYLKENSLDSLNREGKRVLREQLEDIESSLTNDQKKSIAGPIEWIRIHNLPDHVYFNHSQHVSVGKIECQQCHGPVEQMDVVQQHSPLSMGWCINCHRQTEVQFSDNPYYEAYNDYHEALKDGDMDKVTVEDIGGLECQKCHY